MYRRWELGHEGFADDVATILRKSAIAADQIGLELTETALVDNMESTRATLRTLRNMGVHVAIDDVGAGYSSVNYLRHLPVDPLKIDRSFPESLNP